MAHNAPRSAEAPDWPVHNLALHGRNSGKCRYLQGHTLAAAVGADYAALSEISDMKNAGEFLAAILAEENVMRHGRFLFAPSSLPKS
jgi:hypothetical protein